MRKSPERQKRSLPDAAPGFFYVDVCYAKLDEIGDPLVKINEVVDWEGFQPILVQALEQPRKSNAGRKEFD